MRRERIARTEELVVYARVGKWELRLKWTWRAEMGADDSGGVGVWKQQERTRHNQQTNGPCNLSRRVKEARKAQR